VTLEEGFKRDAQERRPRVTPTREIYAWGPLSRREPREETRQKELSATGDSKREAQKRATQESLKREPLLI
jgi:hypothetical protein